MTIRLLPIIALAAAGACATVPAFAQDTAKQEIATELAQLQVKTDGEAMGEQLAATAIQPLIVRWTRQIKAQVPPDDEKEVRAQLDTELSKFTDETRQSISAALSQTATTTLVPIFMDKLSTDDMKTIVAFMKSPASAKFQALGPDATNAWAQAVVDATHEQVASNADAFDAAAGKIVSAAAHKTPATSDKK